MTDGDALLAAILANPEEDTPRLVYADWLQENGDEARAEFIRVQCELYRRFPDHYGFPADKSLLNPHELILDHRCRQLMTARGNDWFPMIDPQIIHLVYRGFICRITCTAADWCDHATAILAQHPVREVTLTTLAEERSDSGQTILGTPIYRLTRHDKATLESMWSGITFTLPPSQPDYSNIVNTLSGPVHVTLGPPPVMGAPTVPPPPPVPSPDEWEGSFS